jgi:hypothetical protein
VPLSNHVERADDWSGAHIQRPAVVAAKYRRDCDETVFDHRVDSIEDFAALDDSLQTVPSAGISHPEPTFSI